MHIQYLEQLRQVIGLRSFDKYLTLKAISAAKKVAAIAKKATYKVLLLIIER